MHFIAMTHCPVGCGCDDSLMWLCSDDAGDNQYLGEKFWYAYFPTIYVFFQTGVFRNLTIIL